MNDSENLEKEDSPIVMKEEQKKARAKAMRLLEHMGRTEKGLYEKLLQAGFSERAAADAIAYVKSFGYLNDQRYAETYLRNRVDTKSRARLMQDLLRKGVDSAVAEAAWEEVIETEEHNERSIIREEIRKKYDEGSALDTRETRRLYGFFARRGFRIGDVIAVMKELDITTEYYEQG